MERAREGSPTARDAESAKDKLTRRYSRMGTFTSEGARVVANIERSLQELREAYAVLRSARLNPSASRTSQRMAEIRAKECYEDLTRRCEVLGEYDSAQLKLLERTRTSVRELQEAMRNMMAKIPEVAATRRPPQGAREISPSRRREDHSPRLHDHSPRREYSPSRHSPRPR
jgi:hypothetical protein